MNQHQLAPLCGLEEALIRLIGLYGTCQAAEKNVTDWFSGVEFEALRPEASCLAAVIGADRDYAGVPRELIPRLQGIHRYVNTLNAGMTAGLCALGKVFREAEIPMLLTGSTAVHLGYPEPPRHHIWQMQLSVPAADFSRAAVLAEKAGFSLEVTPWTIIARKGNTQCVHIRKQTEPVRHTAPVTVGSVSFQLPGSGELLVSLCESVFQLLSGTEPGAKLIPWLMDLRCVIGAGPDWTEAAAAAGRRGTASQVRLVLELYGSLMPEGLPEEIMVLFGSEEHTLELVRLLPEYRSLRPGSAGLKRLWLSTRIRNVDSSGSTAVLFFKELCRAGVRKLTPGN